MVIKKVAEEMNETRDVQPGRGPGQVSTVAADAAVFLVIRRIS